MKRYTILTIILLDTGASGMYQIPASGGMHLGNSVLAKSLSHFSPRSIFPFSSIPIEACLVNTILKTD